MMDKTMGLTIESKVNNKQVLHNGLMGVYGDFTQVTSDTLHDLQHKVKVIEEHLKEKTEHSIIPQTYGVLVMSYVGNKELGKAFVGYDEGVDSKVRLCYATDTFLAMEITRHLNSFVGFGKEVTDDVKKVKNTFNELEQVQVSKVNDVEKTKVSGLTDYGWGSNNGQTGVMSLLEAKVDKVCDSYSNMGILSKSETRDLREKLLKVLHDNKESFTKGGVFNKANPLYGVIQELVEAIKVTIPKTTIYVGENKVGWEINNGETILTVYDKNLGNDTNTGTGNIAVANDTPAFTVLRKFFDLVSSNIGYAKLREKVSNLPKVTVKEAVKREVKQEVKQVVKQEVKQEEKPEVKQVNSEANKPKVNVLSDDYYDIFLAQAGKWGKTDGKYTMLKGIITGLIGEYGIDGVSLRGIDDTEVVIDWVIDRKSHTMALTKKATRVVDLEIDYDMAIAYDTDYPEMVGVLIEDKLKRVVEGSDMGTQQGLLA